MDGWNLINSIDSGNVEEVAFSVGSVSYYPSIKHRVEIEDPEDPTKMIRAGKYHVDIIRCLAPVTPAEYNEIRTLLATAEMFDIETGLGLFIQFDRAGVVKELPIYNVNTLPGMSEDLSFCSDFIEFELESRYVEEIGLPSFTLYSVGNYGAGIYSY